MFSEKESNRIERETILKIMLIIAPGFGPLPAGETINAQVVPSGELLNSLKIESGIYFLSLNKYHLGISV